MDPMFAYNGPGGRPLQVRADLAAAVSGPVLRDLIDQLLGNDGPVHIKIPRLRDEVEEAGHNAQIALNFPPNPNLEFKIADLGQINEQSPLNHVPYYPKFWATCAETVCKLAGMNNQLTATFRTWLMEMAYQMAGVGTADALVPQVADAQALWVILMDTWEDFGPEPWMRDAFRYMLPLTASIADFHLHSMEERFPIVELLTHSADIREHPAYSQLQRMIFCFFGTDVLQPANLKGTVRRVKMIAQLTSALNDIKRNAAGLVSSCCPSEILWVYCHANHKPNNCRVSLWPFHRRTIKNCYFEVYTDSPVFECHFCLYLTIVELDSQRF